MKLKYLLLSLIGLALITSLPSAAQTDTRKLQLKARVGYSIGGTAPLGLPATIRSIGYDLLMKMPKGATVVNTARKEVIDEEGLLKALEEREDLKYVTDVMPDNYDKLTKKFGYRVFATPKKMGAQTSEANVNAGLAAARQIADYFATGNTKFQVNK